MQYARVSNTVEEPIGLFTQPSGSGWLGAAELQLGVLYVDETMLKCAGDAPL